MQDASCMMPVAG